MQDWNHCWAAPESRAEAARTASGVFGSASLQVSQFSTRMSQGPHSFLGLPWHLPGLGTLRWLAGARALLAAMAGMTVFMVTTRVRIAPVSSLSTEASDCAGGARGTGAAG